MQAETNGSKEKNLSIQELLSLGYIYLLTLGIISDAIYYSFFKINILEHATVLDVLLSPLAQLTEIIFAPAVLVVSIGFVYYWTMVLAPRYHQKHRNKKWYRKLSTTSIEKLDKRYAAPPSTNRILVFSAGLILTFYIGLGVGKGWKAASVMKKGEVESDHKIVFRDGQATHAKIIGQNSLYLFYIIENENSITVTPIDENVKQIQRIQKD